MKKKLFLYCKRKTSMRLAILKRQTPNWFEMKSRILQMEFLQLRMLRTATKNAVSYTASYNYGDQRVAKSTLQWNVGYHVLTHFSLFHPTWIDSPQHQSKVIWVEIYIGATVFRPNHHHHTVANYYVRGLCFASWPECLCVCERKQVTEQLLFQKHQPQVQMELYVCRQFFTYSGFAFDQTTFRHRTAFFCSQVLRRDTMTYKLQPDEFW